MVHINIELHINTELRKSTYIEYSTCIKYISAYVKYFEYLMRCLEYFINAN